MWNKVSGPSSPKVSSPPLEDVSRRVIPIQNKISIPADWSKGFGWNSKKYYVFLMLTRFSATRATLSHIDRFCRWKTEPFEISWFSSFCKPSSRSWFFGRQLLLLISSWIRTLASNSKATVENARAQRHLLPLRFLAESALPKLYYIEVSFSSISRHLAFPCALVEPNKAVDAFSVAPFFYSGEFRWTISQLG